MVRRKLETFSRYIEKVLKNSMLTGIPQIVSSGSKIKKFIRTLVFFICIGGFIYQAHEFLDLYWQYKVILDIKVDSPEKITMPAMTVCNFNGIMQSRLTRKYPELKQKFTVPVIVKSTCKCTPHLCNENDELLNDIATYKGVVFATSMAPLDRLDLIQQYDELIATCSETGMNHQQGKTECNKSRIVSFNMANPSSEFAPVCYTINSLINKPTEVAKKVLSSGVIFVKVNPMLWEYTANVQGSSAFVTFHSPYAVHNPFVGRFIMTAGKHYNYRLKKKIRETLSAPYETNCTDYIGLWKARGGYGPTNQEECMQECMMNRTLEDQDCVPTTIEWPNNNRICDSDTDVTFIYTDSQSCYLNKCKTACWEETYSVEVEERNQDIDIEKCRTDTEAHAESDFITFRVYLNNMETTTYSSQPQFQRIETFSYVGGYVGMWLGISLLALFDFLESMVSILEYPCKKKNKDQNTTATLQPTKVHPEPQYMS